MSASAPSKRQKVADQKKTSSAKEQRAISATARKLRRAYARFKRPPLTPTPSQTARLRALPKYREAENLEEPAPVAAFDWRAHIAVASPGQQNPCNSCSSFAVASAIEMAWLIANPGRPISVSPGYIHTCLGHKGETNSADACAGAVDLANAVNLAQTRGYALSTPGDYPFPATSCSATQVAGNITSEALSGSDADSVKARIANSGPIVADLYIWDDFFDYSTNRAPAYVPDMTRQGPWLHSVCVVGFDAHGWIVKNSFGPNWGDGQGFATIAYGCCAFIDAAPPPGLYPREAFAIQL